MAADATQALFATGGVGAVTLGAIITAVIYLHRVHFKFLRNPLSQVEPFTAARQARILLDIIHEYEERRGRAFEEILRERLVAWDSLLARQPGWKEIARDTLREVNAAAGNQIPSLVADSPDSLLWKNFGEHTVGYTALVRTCDRYVLRYARIKQLRVATVLATIPCCIFAAWALARVFGDHGMFPSQGWWVYGPALGFGGIWLFLATWWFLDIGKCKEDVSSFGSGAKQ